MSCETRQTFGLLNKKWLLVLPVLLLAFLATSCCQINENAVRVTGVIDGDTIEIEGRIKVRYIGIDAPETVHPEKPVEYFGKEAAEKNRELVEGKTVRLERDVQDKDKYGRLLRYVWVGDVMVNAELVRLGYAYSSTYPPNVKYQTYFLQLEREAREENRGLWSGR